ncbi:McrB family protein [Acidovorax sp.]|uniref:McrB family protein n=1 Tax=Acidovorax sp. TaxID=1872122 RepID=UPI003CFCDF47
MTEFAAKFHENLAELENSGKLSKTGVGRFDGLTADIAQHISAKKDDVYMVSCARPNNLNIRLTQGRAQHRHFSLGLGVIPDAGDDADTIVRRGLKAGASFIGENNAQYDAVAVVVKVQGKWVVGGIVESPGKGISAKLLPDFPALIVESATQRAKTATVATGVATQTVAFGAPVSTADLSTMVRSFHESLKASQLIFSEEIVTRFCASLLARPFVVLTGLSGSGKTKLAEAFARWITPPSSEGSSPHSKIVPVGADWTSSEQVLGYPDALDTKRYETRPALDLLLSAANSDRKNDVHVLILDEMNLSHVERYFSEFLSAMETGAAIDLYAGADRDLVPRRLELPGNLFVAGTVNVDETTYLFSPKVLDRANVIEFRADEDQVFGYLENFGSVDLKVLDGEGTPYMVAFLNAAKGETALEAADKEAVAEAFRRIFRIMGLFGREFGFRTLRDVGRYIHFQKLLTEPASWEVGDAIDAQIYQRVLPKLHGSRNQLQTLIWALGTICMRGDLLDANFEAEIIEPLRRGATITNPFETTSGMKIVSAGFSGASYPRSSEKLFRMNRKLRDGFVSFMEA